MKRFTAKRTQLKIDTFIEKSKKFPLNRFSIQKNYNARVNSSAQICKLEALNHK